jgi:hypothetical protein
MFADMLSPSLLWIRYERCRKVAVLQFFFVTVLALDICLYAVGQVKSLTWAAVVGAGMGWGGVYNPTVCLHSDN